MYEEGSRKLSFNWVSLALKLVGLAVFVFLLCWIFTKSNNNSNKTIEKDTNYITNITSMKEAAFEYFTESTLPENVGGTQKLSLSQMLNQKLLIDFTDNGDTCDINDSYVQATKTADGAYALKVSLNCGNKNDFIVTTIEKTKCVVENNCPDNSNKEDNNSSTNNTNNNSSNSSNNSNNSNSSNNSSSSSKPNTSNTTTTQKVTTTVTTKVHIKVSCSTCTTDNNNNNNKPEETKETWYKHERYTDWRTGYSYESNAENKKSTTTTYNYCEDSTTTIYTTSYTSNENKHSYGYTLKLLDFKANQVSEGTVGVVNSSKNYFSSSTSDYRAYLNSRDEHISMVGATGKGNSYITNVNTFRSSSLKNSNFTFNVSGAYKSGNYYYVDIDIYVKNANGVTKYYDPTLGYSLYYVPLKFDVSYSLLKNCTRDLAENEYKYKNHSISDPETSSTWIHRLYETKWSKEKSISGWNYTGVSEQRNK